MINKIIIQGNLAADPIFHEATGEKDAFVTLRVIHNSSKEEDADTFAANCIASGEQAKFIARTFGKGSCVVVEGKISDRSWGKDGETKYGTSIRIAYDGIHFAGNLKAPAEIPAGAEKGVRKPVPAAPAPSKPANKRK